VLELLGQGEYRVEDYPLLRAELPSGKVMTAMNDFCINRSLLGGILRLELFLDSDRVASVAGDGVVISTPLGSTAYGLSCGGPILDPALPAMLVVPICAHQLSLRPLVVPDSMTVTVETGELRGGAPFISCDGNPEATMNTGDRLMVTRDEGYCSMIQTRDRGSHYSHLGRKLGWGVRSGDRC
jgi:NAD+ kinase